MARPSGEYDAVAKLLHWHIAAFVLGLIGLGLTMTRTGGLALKFELYQLHKSMGITVLMLMMLRIAWRLFLPPPDLPAMPGWERGAARSTHLLLYPMLLALPLSGWAMVSATLPPFNIPTVIYKAIPWPHIPGIENLSAAAKKRLNHFRKMCTQRLAGRLPRSSPCTLPQPCGMVSFSRMALCCVCGRVF
jgi:cytochrome b561